MERENYIREEHYTCQLSLWGNYMVMKLCQTYIFSTVISLGWSAAKYTVAVQHNSVMSLRQLSLCAMQNLEHPWSKLV